MAEQNAQLFAGDLYVSFETAPGVFGAATLIRTDMLSITTPSDKIEAVSRNRDDYGQAFSSYNIAKPSLFEIQFTEVTRDLLAVQLPAWRQRLVCSGGFRRRQTAPGALLLRLACWHHLLCAPRHRGGSPPRRTTPDC